jgi:hypothetical protein
MTLQVSVHYNAQDAILSEASCTNNSSYFVTYAVPWPLADCHHLILLPDLLYDSLHIILCDLRRNITYVLSYSLNCFAPVSIKFTLDLFSSLVLSRTCLL